jgi:hypothetical protein
MSAGGQPQRVGLELEAGPEAIHGTLEHGDGTREGFWGWLELMAALERVTSPTKGMGTDMQTSQAAGVAGLTLPDPFGEPPSGSLPTWEQFAAVDNAREAALAMGRLHGEMIDRLTALADANGGGLLGLGRGALDLRARQGMITSTDRDRLRALVEHVLGAPDDSDASAVFAQVQQMHRRIVDDPRSTLPALMSSAIAVDSMSRVAATESDTFDSGAATAMADLVATFVALGSGPFGAAGVSYSVSAIVEHVT